MTETKELKNFTYHGHSDIGLIREKNEDRYGYFNTVNGDVFVVCDGIGGVGDGEIAAEKTLESVEAYFSEKWVQDTETLLQDGMRFFNLQLLNEVKNHVGTSVLGTTIALILVRDSKVYYTHIGDSRIYYKTKNKIFRLTSDHSYVQSLINKGKLTESEARFHEKRNIITKALGISGEFEPEPHSSAIKPADEDYILICSDGLSSHVSDIEISKILEKKISLKEKVKILIDKADDYGGEDNITVQLIHFYNTGRKTSDFILSRKKTSLSNRKILLMGALSLISLIGLLLFSFSSNLFTYKEIISNNTVFEDTPISASIIKNNNSYKNITIYKKDEFIGSNYLFNQENIKNSDFVKIRVKVRTVIYPKPGENINFLYKLYKFDVEKTMLLNCKSNFYFKPFKKILIK